MREIVAFGVIPGGRKEGKEGPGMTMMSESALPTRVPTEQGFGNCTLAWVVKSDRKSLECGEQVKGKRISNM